MGTRLLLRLPILRLRLRLLILQWLLSNAMMVLFAEFSSILRSPIHLTDLRFWLIFFLKSPRLSLPGPCRHSWKVPLLRLKRRVGDSHVVAALSGGVDSSVMVALIHKAIGKQLHPIFVDNGLLRKDEAERVHQALEQRLGIEVDHIDASARFVARLSKVSDPEKKRKIIGAEFIKVFEEEASRFPNVRFLAQGTLYPDVIESVSFKGGPSATIKSHHNVGGLPEFMRLELIEPLRELVKDEVRELGLVLGLDESLVWRHPFPGPGLAVRILGEITRERLDLLREADAIAIDEIRKAGLYRDIWQAFVVLLPVRSVGVMGDEKTL